jgi:predicted phage terminase large subunit-like protein
LSARTSETHLLQPQRAPTPEDFAFSRLVSYAAYQWPGYRDAPHHRLIARKLEAVERGEITRLIITMPPRHGKSMLASEYFPAWYLGRNPDHYVIAATYAQELADDFGRKVRNQISDPAFGLIFPGVGIKSDSMSAKRFHITDTADVLSTTQDGAYFAVGVGGPLTGRGAHLLLIDDPVKNREEAESELIRKKTKDWYTSTGYTRLMPGGRVVIIQTRWHEDDLTGWLLQDHGHEGWETLNLPAIDAQGKALWPEQYDIPQLEKIRMAVGPRDWSALYQQRPSPESGGYFKLEWIKSTPVFPPRTHLNVYGASDYAVTADGGDYTVHVVVGVDPDDRIYLLDMWRQQAASDEWVEAFCALVKKWKPIAWAEETGQIKSGVGPFLRKRMMETKAYVFREQFATRGDKAIRAQSIRGRIAMNGLYLQTDAPWKADLVSEMMSFPVGVHDDQVDALGLAGQLIDKMSSGKEPKEKKPLPSHLVLTALPDGRIETNMSTKGMIDLLARQRKKKERGY